MAEFLKSFGEEFWNLIDGALKTKIPVYCKNILTMHGFDNAIALQELTENTLTQCEIYMKETFSTDIIDAEIRAEILLLKAAYFCSEQSTQIANQETTFVGLDLARSAEELASVEETLFRKIGAQTILVFNDAKRCSLSAYSWPSRMVAHEFASYFIKNGVSCNSEELDFSYLSPIHHESLTSSIVKADFENLKSKILQASAVSLRVDASTDRTRCHNIFVMIYLVHANGSTSTFYLGFRVLSKYDASAQLNAIKSVIEDIMPWKEFVTTITS